MLSQIINNSNEDRVRQACVVCTCRSGNVFCSLTEAQSRQLEPLMIKKLYPKGTLLFIEGQPADGVHILCQGRVKFSTCSSEGKTVILGIAEAGEILGLNAVISNVEYEVTTELLENCQINFVSKTDFLRFLKQNGEAGLNAARQLSRRYNAAHKMICSLSHADPVLVKLAKLFLSWSANGQTNNGTLQLKNSFTHEEIAEMIGTARETVTRALREMRERGLVTLKGSDLTIHNHDRLRLVTGQFTANGNGNGNCDVAHRHVAT